MPVKPTPITAFMLILLIVTNTDTANTVSDWAYYH